MQQITSYEGWIGTDAYDSEGNKVGKIDQIYYDDQSQRPEWLAITTGWFGQNTSLVPISGARTYVDPDGNERLQLPYTKDQIKDAPNVYPSGDMSAADEEMLFSHYGYDYTARRYGEDERIDTSYAVTAPARTTTPVDERSEVVDEQEMVTTEEVPHVSKERRETGKVRLRKYVVTEHVVTPVQHEEVRIERE